MFSARPTKPSARDLDGFAREVDVLINRRRGTPAESAAADGDPLAKGLLEANAVIDSAIKPLFDSYLELMQSKGRLCEYKLFPGSIDTFPRRRAAAEFYVGLLGVPGVSEYYFRLENDGGGWLLASRPRLDGRGNRYDSWQATVPGSDRFAAVVEGLLQQFIRLTI